MTMPKLRFREFSDEWKVGKLGDFAKMIKDGTHGSFYDFPGGIPLLSAKDIRENKIFFDNNPRQISQKDFDSIHKTYNLENGDILLTIVGSLGRSAIVRDYKNNYTLQRSVAILRMNDSANPEFISQIFQAEKFQNELKLRENKAIQSGIYLGELAKVPIALPSLPEQQKIAKFLAAMDARIDAGARKLELLRDYKTAVSQKIFARSIRFPGFSDEWISRKLGEIAKITTGKLDANAQIVDGKYPFFTTSVETYRINSYSFDGEAILIAGNGQLGMIKAYTGKFDAYQREYVVMDFREISRDYLAGFLRENLPKRISRMSYGSAMPYITLDVLSEMEILAPTLPEQQKIASFLSALDDKISQNSRNLSALREFKKALLQMLFI